MDNLKIAVFYDWLNQWGGAERLLLDILHIFPKAQLFSTIHDSQNTTWLKNKPVETTFLDKFFKKNNPLVGLFQALAVESLDFSKFDIVISLTSQNGKAILTTPHTLHICYCLNPNRYLYQKKYPKLINPLLNIFKTTDLIYSQRPDYYLTISKTVQNRIKKHYKQKSEIVYPGVDTNFFKANPKTKTKDYYLVVCRLVSHKKVDIAIKSCLKLNRKLVIVGTGKFEQKLKKISPDSPLIKFTGQIGDKELLKHYQQCLALICPQIEDFGLTPLEAQACGKAVIAFNKGGIAETVINGKTGVLFSKQNYQSLSFAIKKFEQSHMKASSCINNAHRFSKHKFMIDFENQVQNLWRQHLSQRLLQTS